MNRLWPDEPKNLVSIPLQEHEICLISRTSRPATYSVGVGTVFSGGKAADHEADHAASSSTQVNEYSSISTPSYAFMVCSGTTVPFTDYKDPRSIFLYIHLYFKAHFTLFGHLCVCVCVAYTITYCKFLWSAVLRMAARPLSVTTERLIPVKNTLDSRDVF